MPCSRPEALSGIHDVDWGDWHVVGAGQPPQCSRPIALSPVLCIDVDSRDIDSVTKWRDAEVERTNLQSVAPVDCDVVARSGDAKGPRPRFDETKLHFRQAFKDLVRARKGIDWRLSFLTG